jgi:hypothetical protein
MKDGGGWIGGGGCSPLPTSHMTGGRPHEKEEGVGVRVSSLEKGGAPPHLRTYTHAPFRPCQGCFQMLQRWRGRGMFSPIPLYAPVGHIFECWEGEAVLSSCSAFAPLSGRFSDSQREGGDWPQRPPSCSAFLPLSKGFSYGSKTALSLRSPYTVYVLLLLTNFFFAATDTAVRVF